MSTAPTTTSRSFTFPMLWAAGWLLFAKVFLDILLQYRFYFPPDFRNGAFLIGREAEFTSLYRFAFYIHLVAGPLALLGAAVLVWTAVRPAAWHRKIGKSLWLATLLGLTPSGVVLACSSRGGWIAGVGFFILSVLTASCVTLAAIAARRGQLEAHRVWAIRSLVLLASPLVLRLMSGVMIVCGSESMATYRLSAWVSWAAPLMVFEWGRRGLRLNYPRLDRSLS